MALVLHHKESTTTTFFCHARPRASCGTDVLFCPRAHATLSPLLVRAAAADTQCDACALAKRRCDGELRCSLCCKKSIPCVYSTVRERARQREGREREMEREKRKSEKK